MLRWNYLAECFQNLQYFCNRFLQHRPEQPLNINLFCDFLLRFSCIFHFEQLWIYCKRFPGLWWKKLRQLHQAEISYSWRVISFFFVMRQYFFFQKWLYEMIIVYWFRPTTGRYSDVCNHTLNWGGDRGARPPTMPWSPQ